ncbi:AAA family ATPase [Methanomethylophilus alvi]|uniref:AAA family ATPase n=1 Tax=Methanomethylophilus alvi TaxID=1291540 RepID=UPI0037DC4D85
MTDSGELIRSRYIDKLTRLKGNGMVKALSGMRNVGKSTILRQYRESLVADGRPEGSIICVDCESLDFDGVDGTDMMTARIREAAGNLEFYVLFIDEPEKVEGWTAALYNLLQEGRCDIYISSSTDIGPIIKGSSIKDRVQEIRVDPLSLQEFMDLNGLTDPISSCERYSRIGGLPIVRADMDDDLAMAILRSTLSDILFNGALDQKGGDDPERLKALVRFIMGHLGQPVQMKDITEAIDKNQLFADKCLKAITENFVVFEQEDEGSKLLKSQMRFYASDAGIRSCIRGAGREWEDYADSMVYTELIRRGYEIKMEKYGETAAFVADTPKGRAYYMASPTVTPDEEPVRKFGFGPKTGKRRIQVVPRSEVSKGGMGLSDLLLGNDLVE